MSDITEKEMKLEEYYKQLVSRIILKIYTSQQKIINKLNLEIIELKLILSEHKKNIVETSDSSDD